MKKSHNGDIESLIIEHTRYLYKLAYRLTGIRESAEDLVQDLFVNLCPNDEVLRDVQHPRAWLTTVLYRAFIKNVRRENRSPFRQYRTYRCQAEEHCSNYIVENTVCEQQGPEGQTAQSQLKEHLAAALNKINEDQRSVLILHDVEGYTLLELEAMMEVPVGTLKSRLHRARNKLEGLLKPKNLL